MTSRQCSERSLRQQPDSGLFVLLDAFTLHIRNLIIRLAAQYRIPAVYTVRQFAESGGLVSYGVDFANQFRQAAIYADRILKGAKPGELPVQQPTKFELVVNLKTAKALGLTIPEFVPTAGRRRDRLARLFAAVHNGSYWHKADIEVMPANVRF